MIFKINVMNEINEIKLPEGIDRISVKQPWSDEPKKKAIWRYSGIMAFLMLQ